MLAIRFFYGKMGRSNFNKEASMQRQKFESGRTLLETLAVLVVMAILILGSVTGYDFVIKKYRENETVKAVSELAVRYKLRPVKGNGKFVQIKDIFHFSHSVHFLNCIT